MAITLLSVVSEFFVYCLNWLAEVLSGVFGGGAQFLFDAEDLVVLSQTLGTAWSASFDLIKLNM